MGPESGLCRLGVGVWMWLNGHIQVPTPSLGCSTHQKALPPAQKAPALAELDECRSNLLGASSRTVAVSVQRALADANGFAPADGGVLIAE